jgi:hypothetical protein
MLEWTSVCQNLLGVTSALAMLGLFTRPMAAIAAVLSIFVLGVPQLYFKVLHGLQVPVLTALILAVSPAGDAVSVDALLRRVRGIAAPGLSIAYSLPVRFAWLLVGTSYLFPGFWKLWLAGDLWVDGTRMRSSLFEKWAQLPDYEPLFRPDNWPWFLIAGGTATLVFELGFLPATLFRTSRIVAGLTAAAFHIGVGITMTIWFDPVYPLIVLLDFPQVLDSPIVRPIARRFAGVATGLRERWARVDAALVRLGQRWNVYRECTAPRRISWPLSLLVGATTFGSMVYAGVVGFHSWPVSVYPKFAGRTKNPPRKSYGLTFHAKAPDGTERDLVTSFLPVEDSASIYLMLNTAKRRMRRDDEEGAMSIYGFITRIVLGNNPPLARGERVVIRQFEFWVDPARRDGKRGRSEVLVELDPPPYVPAP